MRVRSFSVKGDPPGSPARLTDGDGREAALTEGVDGMPRRVLFPALSMPSMVMKRFLHGSRIMCSSSTAP